jgi:phenylacetate-CoA ligase
MDSRCAKAYAKMPVWLQNGVISLAGVKHRRLKDGPCFTKTLSFLKESDNWSLAEMNHLQDERLRWLIHHAVKTVPYYRELFRKLGLNPQDIESVNDLTKLPTLTKKMVKDRWMDFISEGWPERRRVCGQTGGTTGTSLSLVEDRDTWVWNWATVWRHRARFGLNRRDSYVTFGGRLGVVPLNCMATPFWRRNYIGGQTYVSVHHMTKENMEHLVEYLQKRHVEYYCGYPSALALLANYMLNNRLRLPCPPRVVITNSETLSLHQRQQIIEAFGSEVTDLYGQTEHCCIISECEKHQYHVDMEFGIVELLPIDAQRDRECRIVCTGLRNPVMPLIRYDTGDLATPVSGDCLCGRKSQCIKHIDGRIESCIFTPDGRQLGRLDHLFKSGRSIQEAQFVQDSIGEVTIRIVRSRGYGEPQERAFLTAARGLLGEQIRIHLDYVEAIPREANGKFRQVISKPEGQPDESS